MHSEVVEMCASSLLIGVIYVVCSLIIASVVNYPVLKDKVKVGSLFGFTEYRLSRM